MDGVLFYQTSLLYLLFSNGDAFYRIAGKSGVCIRITFCNRIHHIHAFNDLPKNGIAHH